MTNVTELDDGSEATPGLIEGLIPHSAVVAAVRVVSGWYPVDGFPVANTSAEGRAAALARRTCENVLSELANAAANGDFVPVQPVVEPKRPLIEELERRDEQLVNCAMLLVRMALRLKTSDPGIHELAIGFLGRAGLLSAGVMGENAGPVPRRPEPVDVTSPERIWLNMGNAPTTFAEARDGVVTWAAAPVDGQDVAYVRADLAAPQAG